MFGGWDCVKGASDHNIVYRLVSRYETGVTESVKGRRRKIRLSEHNMDTET
jgi:hypothetical protein